MRRPIAVAVLAVLAAAGLLAGLIAAGQHLRGKLKDDPRYQFPVADIDCPTPSGLSREAFLGEVRYQAELPDELSLLDDELPMRLSAAFSRHPWVEKTERVEVGPGRSVRIRLTFRTPVLAVSYAEKTQVVRAVDRSGVLLPHGADIHKLPQLTGRMGAPKNGPGLAWGDSRVEGAAKVAGLLHPHEDKFKISRLEWRSGELFLARGEAGAGPTVIWGKPPDVGNEGEASAEQKLQRLLDYCREHGGLEHANSKMVLDLRESRGGSNKPGN
jgi:hypothetical protein